MTIEKSLPNMVMVCVDGVENGDIYGRYFHRYKKEETFFPDSATLVIEMERFYDAIGYPQAATKTRKFMERKGGRIPAKEHMAVISDSQTLMQFRGKLATFLVGVTSRQNASWQGQVVWMEQKIRKHFCSDMDLMVFVDEAVKKKRNVTLYLTQSMIIYTKEKKVAIMAENQKGTFIVKINHTDNASWQGQVTWADKNITKNFRSTLELIKLMDGAITSEETKNS